MTAFARGVGMRSFGQHCRARRGGAVSATAQNAREQARQRDPAQAHSALLEKPAARDLLRVASAV